MTVGRRPNPDLRRRLIMRQAEQVLEEDGCLGLGVDLEALAARRDILIQGKPATVTGVSGMLLRHGDSFGIIYATDVPVLGFQRFSIAHELGHYFLDGHPEQLLPADNSVHVSRAEFASADPFEREADYFASGLLLPETPFKAALRSVDDGLDAVCALASEAKTSLTATAIRFADVAVSAVAVVVSTAGVIDYAFLSEPMKGLPDITWPKRGSVLPPSSLTHRFNQRPENVLRGARASDDCDLSDWLSGSAIRGIEEVVGLGRQGRTLTVLTTTTMSDDRFEDEDDEPALVESWTPRFR